MEEVIYNFEEKNAQKPKRAIVQQQYRKSQFKNSTVSKVVQSYEALDKVQLKDFILKIWQENKQFLKELNQLIEENNELNQIIQSRQQKQFSQMQKKLTQTLKQLESRDLNLKHLEVDIKTRELIWRQDYETLTLKLKQEEENNQRLTQQLMECNRSISKYAEMQANNLIRKDQSRSGTPQNNKSRRINHTTKKQENKKEKLSVSDLQEEQIPSYNFNESWKLYSKK